MEGPQAGIRDPIPSEREARLREFLQQIRAGDAQSLASLYDATSTILYSFALRILKNPADAEEVLLDVFEQVWQASHKYDPSRGTVWRWLTLMVRSRALDRLRTKMSKQSRDHFALSEDWDLSSSEPLPDEATMFRQTQFRIRQALHALPREQRQAVELAYFSELSHTEIAATLGVPLGTIKTRIRMGMDKLRISLSARAISAEPI